jgi:Icc-related predicted phosphoesterase
MKILTISDRVDEVLYSTAIRRALGDVDLVLSCGDLPHYYLEFILTMLGGPLFYVAGNHANEIQGMYDVKEKWEYPEGGESLDGRAVRCRGLLLAGLEGSNRYSDAPYFQYTQGEMTAKMWHLAPWLVINKLLYGRYLDILITHAPPYGIHDRPDPCHTGFRAFLTLMNLFRPQYLIHGHVHLYGPNDIYQTRYRDTMVVNTYGYRTLNLEERQGRLWTTR